VSDLYARLLELPDIPVADWIRIPNAGEMFRDGSDVYMGDGATAASSLTPINGGGGGGGSFQSGGIGDEKWQIGAWPVLLTSPLATPSHLGYRGHDSYHPNSTSETRYGSSNVFPQQIQDSSQRRWNWPEVEDKRAASYRSIDDNLTSDQNADDRLITPRQARRTDQALLSLLRELF